MTTQLSCGSKEGKHANEGYTTFKVFIGRGSHFFLAHIY